jgi:hypothetical protein
MSRAFVAVSNLVAGQGIAAVATRMHQAECRVSVVVENAEVAGLLTVRSTGGVLALNAAGRQRGSSAELGGGADR